ncbi:MFS transporter [Klebsiella pneumoniae]|nr:MFS transporter [Klebsiella pneumoniae]
MKKVVVSSTIGTALEFYDFSLYGLASALVFSQVFFSSVSAGMGTLAAFATFAVGFIARPVGAVIFGHLGDRVGRKSILIITLLLMGLPTFCIGLIPSFDSIGIAAPIILITLRFIQGVGLGGETGGAQLMNIEHAPAHERGYYGAWMTASSPLGSAMSAIFMLSISLILSKDDFIAWGWRIPFLLSIIIVLVGMFVRHNVDESPVFLKMKTKNEVQKIPAMELIKQYPQQLIIAVAIWTGATICFYINTVFSVSYVKETLHLDQVSLLTIMIIINLVSVVFPPMAGTLSDRIGRRPVMAAGAIASIIIALIYFPVLNSGNPIFIFGIIMAFNATLFTLSGAQPSYFSEMFGARVRYSGVSITYTLGNLFGGGIAPFIAAALLMVGQFGTVLISGYIIVSLLITLFALFMAKETVGINLYDNMPDERGNISSHEEEPSGPKVN